MPTNLQLHPLVFVHHRDRVRYPLLNKLCSLGIEFKTYKMSTEIPKIDAASLFSVHGLVAVITGGGSGLGAMMARALAVNGAQKVFIIGRREDSLKKVASSLPGIDTIIPIVGDVTSKDNLKNCVEQVKKQVSHIDVLVANSGISGPSTPLVDENQQPLPFEKFAENMFSPTPEAVTSTYAVNIHRRALHSSSIPPSSPRSEQETVFAANRGELHSPPPNHHHV